MLREESENSWQWAVGSRREDSWQLAVGSRRELGKIVLSAEC